MARQRRKSYKKKCANCGTSFKATRRDAKFCSAYCRTDNWRMTNEQDKLIEAQAVSQIEEYTLHNASGVPVEKQTRMIRINGVMQPF